MIGVVLCGGQSSRMGQDKGLIKLNGVTWAKIAFEKLTSLGLPTLVSVNEMQFPKYQKHFGISELVVDHRDLAIQGPLVGVLSAHLANPDQDILVVACDMINLQPIILKKLLDEYQLHPSEAISFKGENIEPLCTIYSAHGLKKIRAKSQSRSLEKNSMRYVLEILHTTYLPFPFEWQSFLRNFNEPADLRSE